MAKQTIGIGTVANDDTGDTLRDAFDKANDNFVELYASRWVISADAPTETDKVWIDSPAIAGVYDVKKYIDGGWKQVGWYSVDGKFSTRPPINIVLAGQSNAVGIGTGGDTDAVPGVLVWSSGVEWNSGDPQHEGVAWETAELTKGPFFESGNNAGWQLGKLLLQSGQADIVRLIVVGYGGQSIDGWIDSGTATKPYYDDLIDQITNSGLPQIDWFYWIHGESGGVTAAGDGGYYTDLQELLTQLRAEPTWTDTTKFVAGGTGTDTSATWQSTGATPEGAIRRLKTNNDPWVNSYRSTGIDGDGTHFSGDGLRECARRALGVFNELPKQYSEPKWSYDRLDTDQKPYVETVSAYANGPIVQELNGIQYGWTADGTFVISVNATGIVTIGDPTLSYSGSGGPFNVNGKMGLRSPNNSALVGDGFDPTGTHANNVFLGVYTSQKTTADVTDTTCIGKDAGNGSTKLMSNSVFVGSEAGYGIAGGGFGDYMVCVGRYAGKSANGTYQTFVGGASGQSAVGDFLTAIGHSAGAVDGSTYNNSTAIGVGAKWTASNQVVLGDGDITQLKCGKLTLDVATAPATGTLTPDKYIVAVLNGRTIRIPCQDVT